MLCASSLSGPTRRADRPVLQSLVLCCTLLVCIFRSFRQNPCDFPSNSGGPAVINSLQCAVEDATSLFIQNQASAPTDRRVFFDMEAICFQSQSDVVIQRQIACGQARLGAARNIFYGICDGIQNKVRISRVLPQAGHDLIHQAVNKVLQASQPVLPALQESFVFQPDNLQPDLCIGFLRGLPAVTVNGGVALNIETADFLGFVFPDGQNGFIAFTLNGTLQGCLVHALSFCRERFQTVPIQVSRIQRNGFNNL